MSKKNKPLAAQTVPSSPPEPFKPWRPDWRWHVRTLGAIYLLLIVFFFAAHRLLKPYLRVMPAEVVPWLHKNPPLLPPMFDPVAERNAR